MKLTAFGSTDLPSATYSPRDSRAAPSDRLHPPPPALADIHGLHVWFTATDTIQMR